MGGGALGKAADAKGVREQVERPSSQAPAMPGIAAPQQAVPEAPSPRTLADQLAPARSLKAKSEVAPPVEQEAAPVDDRRRVVFVLHVLDAKQFAAKAVAKPEAGRAKAAAVDAARAAPAAAEVAAPAKPAATPAPASPAKR